MICATNCFAGIDHFVSFKDVQISRSKTVNPKQNFDKQFDWPKIELKRKVFSSYVKFSLVSGTQLKFFLSAVVLKIQHVEVDAIKSQDICSINPNVLTITIHLKAYQFVLINVSIYIYSI